MKSLYVFGLTAGVAGGKSTAARLLARITGGVVLDADRASHEALADPEVLSALVARFGSDMLAADGTVSRSALAARVFAPSGADDLKALEALLHPRVRAGIQERLADLAAEKDAPGVAVLDVPLLHEAGLISLCDFVIHVDTPESDREERARARGWSASERERREALQLPLETKRKLAGAVIQNNADETHLEQRLNAVVAALGLAAARGQGPSAT